MVLNGPSPHSAAPVQNAGTLLQARYGLSGRFLFVPGRTDYTGKGLDLILDAYERVKNDKYAAGLKMVFVGPPGDGHDVFLNHLARVDRRPGTLAYLGRVDDQILGALYQECLATVLPSRFEGFGFPVLEAMDRGVPVLCSDAGSLPEVAGDGALLFHAGDVADLCRNLARLLQEPALRQGLVQKGRDRSHCFSWEKCARDMLAVFERVARQNR